MVFLKNHNSSRFSPCQQAILTTLMYSDMFHFAPTKEEIWRLLISNTAYTKRDVFASLVLLCEKGAIAVYDGQYCFPTRHILIKKTQKKALWSRNKYVHAVMLTRHLAVIPTVLFIGISGSVAVRNARADDDIDLFIITKRDSLYKTRFMLIIVLELFRVRRRPHDTNVANTLCVNTLIDDSALSWPSQFRSVYVAREIAQVVPIFERNGTYRNFMDANRWITMYLPHTLASLQHSPQSTQKENIFIQMIQYIGICIPEWFARMVQQTYMKKHRTREFVSKHALFFHPVDYGTKTMRLLRLKMRDLGLLTIW